jgi:4-diphosphocytidyl-2-C-methyl-D-erythritol kinase
MKVLCHMQSSYFCINNNYQMVLFPNAKINLGLQVHQKRTDGFHNIETVFYPFPLCDAIEMIVAQDQKFGFSSSGIPIPGRPEENLCIRAWELMQKDFGLPMVKIHLHKVIPMGAGLGGGSSDGAFILKLINSLFKLNLTDTALQDYARILGSDCAFFIKNKPAFAFGRGDQFEALPLDLSGFFAVLVKPDVHISTSNAYAAITPAKSEIQLPLVIKKPISEWKSVIYNDFENPVFEQHPIIEKIKNQLYERGAVFALMSGSGSAVFGIFEREVDLKEDFRNDYYWGRYL